MSTVANLSLADYDRMIASGFFAREDQQEQRIELIEGEHLWTAAIWGSPFITANKPCRPLYFPK